jgi:hypothetical protein
MAIWTQPTFAEMGGAVGPYNVQVLLGRATGEPRWVDVQWVPTMEDGLRVASRMEQCYEYRLYLGKAHGYVYLEWVDDADDADMCVPTWVDRG